VHYRIREKFRAAADKILTGEWPDDSDMFDPKHLEYGSDKRYGHKQNMADFGISGLQYWISELEYMESWRTDEMDEA
jgi:hypothetical protein